jgi:hypothetical protein
MVEEAFGRAAAARAVVERLVADEAIEVADQDGLVAEIDGFLERFEADTREAVDAARDAHEKYLDRRDAFETRAREAGFFWGDTATIGMRPGLAALLEASPNVDELFADDDLLQQVLDLSLLRYVGQIEEERLARLREGCDKPRGPAAAVAARPPLEFDFPLWDAPREDACLDEPGGCSACKTWADPRFYGLCYPCFRAGRTDAVMGTELGMIRPEEAARGVTHGTIVGDDFDARGTEALPPTIDGDERWTSFRVAEAWLQELLRTPQYHTWQGENWLFCCGRPMIYAGSTRLPELTAWGAESGRTPEQLVVAMLAPDPIEDVEAFMNHVTEGKLSLYSFRCPTCSKRRAHWDRD